MTRDEPCCEAELFSGLNKDGGEGSSHNAGDPGSVSGSGSSLRRDRLPTPVFGGFPGGSDGKESTCNAGDLGLIPGLG